jgi:hypothetical protein
MARLRTNKSAAPPRPAAVPPNRPQIVQGIRLNVTGRELAVRLGERIRWHRERGDALIEQMKRLPDLERDGVHDLATVLGHYDSPRHFLERKLREHQERASFLAFLRDHIAQEVTYRLDSGDLRITEILPDRPW